MALTAGRCLMVSRLSTKLAATVALPSDRRRSISLLVPPGTPDMPAKTNAEIVQNLCESVIGTPDVYDPVVFRAQRERLLEMVPQSQDELPTRRMLDSFDQSVIPLGSNSLLRERYVTHLGGVRVGRLLEDMDVFAVHLVFKHILNPKQPEADPQSPFSIVTALVDRIDVKGPIAADQDIKMMGHVTWVGKSSAEATLELFQLREGQWVHVTDATFVMVARDPLNRGSSFINRLEAKTEAERDLLQRGVNNKLKRLETDTESLLKHPPSEEEKKLIHDFFIKTVDHKALSFKARILPDNSRWMETAKLKNILICHPEYRNRFNKIFGGFIMRQAFELAWATTYVYSRKRPVIVRMDDILFQKPVSVGSLLYFSSQIVYTDGSLLQTRVSAEVLVPHTGELSVTNVFHYTFDIGDDIAPNVIPKTYHEAMLFLEGRRHFLSC